MDKSTGTFYVHMWKSKRIAIFSILVILSLGIIFSNYSVSALPDQSQGKARFIAPTTDNSILTILESKGCSVKHVFTISSALDCPPGIAKSLGLVEDFKIHALGDPANGQIGADLAHVAGFTGTGITIAVLDTGIDYTHVQLQSSIAPGIGKDFVHNDDDPFDHDGHGTFVAGLITSDDVPGTFDITTGSAPEAKIWAGKVLHGGTGNLSDLVAAIKYVHENNKAQIITMSLGTNPPYTSKVSDCGDLSSYSIVIDLTTEITTARSNGIMVIASAGNSGGAGIGIPGCIPGVFTVGATDIFDVKASFSSKGASLEVVALGVNNKSTFPGNNIATGSGTSFSTPVVAGAAALLLQQDSSLTPSAVELKLTGTAVDLGRSGYDTSYGWGRIDVASALDLPPPGGLPDNTSPTPAITSTATSPTNTTPIPISVDFGETVTGFVEGDVTVGNGAITPASFTGVDTDVFTFTVIPTTDGDVTVNIAANMAQDLAGNWNNAATQFSITFDTTSPGSGNNLTGGIEMSGDSKVRGGTESCKAKAQVTIIDQDGNSVADATVDGLWSVPPGSVSGTTNGKGMISFRTGWVACDPITFSVDVSKAGYIYDPPIPEGSIEFP